MEGVWLQVVEALRPLQTAVPEHTYHSMRAMVSGSPASSNVSGRRMVVDSHASAYEVEGHSERMEAALAHAPGSSSSSVSGDEAAVARAVRKSTSTSDCLSDAQPQAASAAVPWRDAQVAETAACFACS